MKRALRSKVKAELKTNPSEDAPVDNLNLPSQKVNRRTRTSAAMIGLAISMGAGSLLVTRQSDQALAAEPVGNQNTASAIPAAGDTGVKLATTLQLGSQAVSSNVSAPENPVPVVEPTAISQVPGLGAKWQIAASRTSNVFASPASSVTKTATVERGSVSSVPQTDKGLRITSAIASLQAQKQVGAVASSYGVTNSSVAQSLTLTTQTPSLRDTSSDVNAQLKAQQEFAISRLQQKSNRLRDSLTQLRSGETDKSLPQVTKATGVNSQSQYTSTPNLGLSAGNSSSITEQLPSQVPSAFVPQASKVYEVKSGDTLAAIASNNGTSVSDLVKANGLKNPDELKISQKLNIPVANTPINATPSIQTQDHQVPVASNVAIPTPARSGAVATNDTTVAPVVVPSPTATSGASVESFDSTPVDPSANGVGGDTPVPKVFAEMQQRNNTRNKQAKEDRGLRSLQAEIERLREKYRAQQSGNSVPTQVNYDNFAVPTTSTPSTVAIPQVPTATKRNEIAIPVPTVRPNTVAVPIPVPTPMAPYSAQQPVNPEWSSRNGRNQRSAPPLPTTVNASESLGNMRGVTVSPQLPPLAAAGSADRFLPRAIDENTSSPVIPGDTPGVGNTSYIWPAKGVLTSGYGWRWGRMHRGIDVANSVGTPIYAVAPGVVEKSGWNRGGYGNLVEIRHADGTMTRYAHNSKLLVQVGQQVPQGHIIALMGSTGFSTGPHTHFEIHRAGKGAVNPIAMLPPRV
ncbi:MAG: peptidoglycan DD-metalloendopeptidase family protein [Calothrix sp. C42_A2020_038]|nr:peptidoglycan DD-metalloendopeptidase family protein [Calothrix sp. C42_A2020_038]